MVRKKPRAMKIQPYFQSAFPYDHDQWISEIRDPPGL